MIVGQVATVAGIDAKMVPRGAKMASRGADDAKMASRNTPRWR